MQGDGGWGGKHREESVRHWTAEGRAVVDWREPMALKALLSRVTTNPSLRLGKLVSLLPYPPPGSQRGGAAFGRTLGDSLAR